MTSESEAKAVFSDLGDAGAPARARSSLYFVCRGIQGDPFALSGGLVFLAFVGIAIAAPWLAPYHPNEAEPWLRLRGPGTEGHLLGLDGHGRDILSRLIFGTRISLITGFAPVILGSLIAIPLGTIAAYYERIGQVIMRLMDVFFAFPMVLLAILFAAFLGPGLINMIIALTIVLIPYNTRIVFIEAASQKQLGYVEAARAAASSDLRILFVEMLPHVVSAAIVYSMTIVGPIIIIGAGLSFLGLGAQPPTAEWGLMTSDGRLFLHRAPHVATLPGIAIFVLVTAVNLFGDGLRDALDPRTRLLRVRAAQGPQ